MIARKCPFVALAVAVATIGALGCLGCAGCNALTRPDDIVVAPEPRRQGAAAPQPGAPPPSAQPAARPAGR